MEAATGRMLGTADVTVAVSTLHPGAVYLHRGVSFVVDSLELDADPKAGGGLALVHPEEPDWWTSARSVAEVAVLGCDGSGPGSGDPGSGGSGSGAPGSGSGDRGSDGSGGVRVRLGEVAVTSQVVSYLRRRTGGEVIETVPLDLPAQTLRTRAVWYTVEESVLAAAGLAADRIPGALHAAEHAAIGLLPLFAVCDRWDVGGMSTARHPDTGLPTVFVHDGHPGGAGFAERGYADVVPWLTATREAITGCECPSGCPSCVQSPKCGNGNHPLDKPGAVIVLDLVLNALRGARAGRPR